MSGKEKIKGRMNTDGDTGIPKQNTSTQTVKNKTDYDPAWKEVCF
jgi:hypothetical protein